MPHTGHWTLSGIASPTLLVHLQLLTRLLRSSHPEDLQAANRLIKSLVKEVGIFPLRSAEPALDRGCTVSVGVCVCEEGVSAQLSGGVDGLLIWAGEQPCAAP